MKRLEDMSIGHRVALTVAIVLVILFALALCGYLTGGWEDAGAATLPPSKYDKRIIELDRLALEQAYMTQIVHVFSIWVKDGLPPPQRAAVGFRNARQGYVDAMNEIERREQAK